MWTATPPYGVLFCRGPEKTAWKWEGNPGYKGVLVPGQRIWLRSADGTEKPLTTGPGDTADYLPGSSPDGRNFTYIHLTGREQGALCLQTLDGGKAEQLLYPSGGSGYYGNYYPGWVSIYWTQGIACGVKDIIAPGVTGLKR